MISVQFSGDMLGVPFDADAFEFDGVFVLLSKDGKNVAAVRADLVQFIKKLAE